MNTFTELRRINWRYGFDLIDRRRAKHDRIEVFKAALDTSPRLARGWRRHVRKAKAAKSRAWYPGKDVSIRIFEV